jgi:probable HAF family extracellular repeat protein
MKLYDRLILAASICLAAAGGCLAQPTYTAAPIQAAGSNFNRLEWLSDDGTLAFGETSILLENGSRMQPCVQYKDGAFTTLPTPNFACSGIRGNNSGAFAGTLIGADIASSGFQAFVYQNDTFTLVAPLKPGEAGTSFARGVNDRGDVAGYAVRLTGTSVNLPNPDGTTSSLPVGSQSAFIYSGGQLRKLDGLAGGNAPAMATGINNDGDVIGWSEQHAVLWPHGGGIVDLGVLPGDTDSMPLAINSNGQIAGLSHPLQNTFDPTFPYRAFFYDGGAMTPIPVPGVVGSSGVFMNDSGEVLVSSYDPTLGQAGLGGSSMRPFYYKDGQAFDLNTLVTNLPAGVRLSQPLWINNAGQILVISLSDSAPVEYLLTPETPTPSANDRSKRTRSGR